MPDKNSLAAIGLSFALVTFLTTGIAAVVVANEIGAARNPAELPPAHNVGYAIQSASLAPAVHLGALHDLGRPASATGSE